MPTRSGARSNHAGRTRSTVIEPKGLVAGPMKDLTTATTSPERTTIAERRLRWAILYHDCMSGGSAGLTYTTQRRPTRFGTRSNHVRRTWSTASESKEPAAEPTTVPTTATTRSKRVAERITSAGLWTYLDCMSGSSAGLTHAGALTTATNLVSMASRRCIRNAHYASQPQVWVPRLPCPS